MMEFDVFNIFSWIDPARYREFWYFAVNSLFNGFTSRFIASLCLFFSIYSIVTRRFRPAFSVMLFVVAMVVTYGGGLIFWFIDS